MTLEGIKDLLPFLDWLDKKNVHYTLSKLRPESIMASIHIIGKRIEVEFFDDHIEYSVFSGNEDVLDDVPALIGMIEDFVQD